MFYVRSLMGHFCFNLNCLNMNQALNTSFFLLPSTYISKKHWLLFLSPRLIGSGISFYFSRCCNCAGVCTQAIKDTVNTGVYTHISTFMTDMIDLFESFSSYATKRNRGMDLLISTAAIMLVSVCVEKGLFSNQIFSYKSNLY